MRGKFLAASLAVLVGGSSIGCKTMPNMAWWKTASKDAPEANVLAHSAPALPSEIAKQVEGLSTSSSEQLAGGTAAPFMPTAPVASVASTTAPGPYPSTEAPTFTPPTAPVATVPAAPSSANLGSLAMPYNPNAVPPAANAVAPAATPPNVDRYAAAPTTGSSTKPPATPYPSTASRYGEQVAATPVANVSVPTTSAASQLTAPNFVDSPTASLGGRYAQTAAVEVPTASLPVDNSLAVPTVTPTSPATTTVAEASPYRPGGTSSYPTTPSVPASVQIASRPEAPATTITQEPTNDQPIVPATPQVPRYR